MLKAIGSTWRAPVVAASFALFAGLILPANTVQAAGAADFLKTLEGNFSGKGIAKILGDQQEAIACKVTNTYDSAAARLTVNGNCASTQGKDSIRGSVTASGNTLKGTFISPRANTKVTRSGGSVSKNRMILNATVYNEAVQRLTEIRQVISPNGNGFNAEFLTLNPKTKKYEKAGSIAFKRR